MKKTRLTEKQLHDLFDEYLDAENSVEIWGLKYQPSEVLKSVDPTAYRCSLNDFADSVMDEYWIEGYSPDDEDPDLTEEEE